MTIEKGITIERAIELLTNGGPQKEVIAAERLGIEALAAVKRSRILWGSRGVEILPGETEE